MSKYMNIPPPPPVRNPDAVCIFNAEEVIPTEVVRNPIVRFNLVPQFNPETPWVTINVNYQNSPHSEDYYVVMAYGIFLAIFFLVIVVLCAWYFV